MIPQKRQNKIVYQEFIDNVILRIKSDSNVLGVAAGGSWITNKIDEFSDLDLILVSRGLISSDFHQMFNYARSFGNLLNAFTGEHVGEKRLLICLYDNPLIHVDIKFITADDLLHRVEDPVILWDRDGTLENIIMSSTAKWPDLNYQWIEDRFWTWIHYASLKLGRGEYFEALDFLSFLRTNILSPLQQIKNKQLPRGLRKIEQTLSKNDLQELIETVPVYSAESITYSLEKAIKLYRDLRDVLFPDSIILRTETENKCTEYFYDIKKGIIP